MKNKSLFLGLILTVLVLSKANAQFNLNKGLDAAQKGMTGFTFSDADAAVLSKAAIEKMDKENPVANQKDPYTVRLNKIFGKYTNTIDGIVLNYKVYKVKDVNAFATADGSVRVFSGLMDIMDDNELLSVIGHEIGHVANHDSRDGVKAAYKKEALMTAAGSVSNKMSTLTDSQLGQIGSAMIDSKHSRKQELEADLFSYNFMKKNGYDVNAQESAFKILQKISEGADASFLDKMMSSHPNSKDRAENSRKRAEKDELYRVYVKQPIVNTAPKAIAKKAIAKKAIKKKI